MRSKLKIIPLLIALLIAPQQAGAESPAAVDIKESINLTLENNASLLSLKQEIIKAAAFKVQADGTLLPSISASVNIDKQREPQTSDGTDKDSSKSAKVTLEQTIYSGGRDSALRRQSPQAANIADAALRDGENRIIGELFARFYNVILQQEKIKTEEAAVKTSEMHLKEVKKMNELGLANRLEVIRAAQKLASNYAELSTAQGSFKAAHISLMSYMAIPPESRRAVKGSISSWEIKGSRAESLAFAEKYRADLQKLKEEHSYQLNQIEIEKSALRPKITFGATSGISNPYKGDDRSEDTWRAELSVKLPIFDKNAAQSALIKNRAILEQDKIAVKQKEIDVKSEVETSWAEIESAKDRLAASEKALELAKETLRLSEVGYREGVTPQLDLLSAQSALTLANLNFLNAQYNRFMTIVALKMTEGTIIDWAKESDFK